MILVHVLWHWGRPETWTTPVGEAISYMAGPTAAPVFAFLMGASLGAAPRQPFGSLAARGLWLLVLGYVLNVLRGVIPAYLGLSSGVITAAEVQPYTLWWLGTTVDLHHMIGLSLIAAAALRTRVEPNWLWVGIAGALVLDGAAGADVRGRDAAARCAAHAASWARRRTSTTRSCRGWRSRWAARCSGGRWRSRRIGPRYGVGRWSSGARSWSSASA